MAADNTVEVYRSDLEKVRDTLLANERFHTYRDSMNGELHLAREVRLSPLTSETVAQRQRLDGLLSEAST